VTDLLEPSEPAPASSATEPAGPGHGLLAALLAGAAAIHLAMAPSHLGESAIEGAGFVVAGWAQLGLAAVLVLRPRRWQLVASIALNAALLAAWLWSRTAGLPFGDHAGHAESVSLVDGLCVALEVAALVVAGALLVPAGRPVARSRGVALVGGVGALVLATAAIASPSARDHASGSHGDHGAEHEEGAGEHEHGPEAVDDLGFAALQNGQMGSHEHPGEGAGPRELTIDPVTAGQLAEQLALTAPLVEAYPTIADAKAAGYRQAGPFAPGLGMHFSRGFNPNSDGDMDPEDIAAPFLIYDGITDDAPLAGFMYLAYQETEPEGFVGDLDRWHYHTAVCIVTTPTGIDTPFGADLSGVTQEMCEAEGGSLLDFTGYMVHVWTVPGYESDLGTFSDLNPRITCPDGSYHIIPVAETGGKDTTCKNP
jgi:hypothetical protein